MIEKGKQVAIEYSVFTDDHKQVDSNVGKDPLVFFYGADQILPALEKSLVGLEVGDSRYVTLEPNDAFGPVNPQAFKEIDAKLIPEDLRFEGALLVMTDERFGEMLIRIESLKKDTVMIDFNHPLAGKRLTFDVKVLDIA